MELSRIVSELVNYICYREVRIQIQGNLIIVRIIVTHPHSSGKRWDICAFVCICVHVCVYARVRENGIVLVLCRQILRLCRRDSGSFFLFFLFLVFSCLEHESTLSPLANPPCRFASSATGVISTQSLIFALGLGAGAGTIPMAAALNWVVKVLLQSHCFQPDTDTNTNQH